MRILEWKRTVKIRIVLPLLMCLCILAGNWVSISHAWTINLAYVDLSHALVRSDDGAATRFERWVGEQTFWGRDHDAAVYGTAILVAKGGRRLPQRWLQEWQSNDSRLKAGTLREQMMLYTLTGALPLEDQLALVANMNAPTAARWLVSAATTQPQQAATFVRIIEDRDLVSALSPEDRIRLATVYGNLAYQKFVSRVYEEALALADRSLTLDPYNEMGLIMKAMTLYYLGQLQAGLVLLDQAIALYPKSVFAWESLAHLRLGAVNFEGAEEAARMAISLGPPGGKSPWAQSMLATALLKQGRCAEALLYAQPPVTVVPDNPYYLLPLADAYWCIGAKEKAAPIYQQLQAIAPDIAPYVQERSDTTR